MIGTDKAYGLRGNPFTLADSLPVDIKNDLRDGLQTSPLRMALEKLLLPYYCDAVYPKVKSWKWTSTPFQTFERLMQERGYSDNPQAVDPKGHSRIVLIRGPRGTGKTTLAQRMMRWLMDCDPVENRWKYIDWSLNPEAHNALEQSESLISKFKVDVEQQGRGRFLCLLDNVIAGVDSEIFRVFQNLLPGRVLFFFITSYDRAILAKRYVNNDPSVIVYNTDTLMPEQAVAYCAERMTALRTETRPAWLAEYPLFPFTQDIIQRSLSPVERGLWEEPGSVALRELNVRFSELLDLNKMELSPAFDISQVPVNEVEKYLIDPTKNDAEKAA